MKRYELNKKKKDKTLRTVYGTIMYPKIERKSSDLYVMSRLGDRLDNLAMEFYKDVTLWWIIAQANNIGKGTLNVPIGTTLRIPQETDIIIETYNEIVRNRKII
jgi:nucleoid-associated protein YgaU